MNPVRKALRDVLEAADLDPATGVYYRVAPNDSVFPYVVYHKSGGIDIPTFRDEITRDTWIVKGVSDSASGAEDVDAACMALLQRSKFAINGRNNYGMLRVIPISYPEQTDGETYHHEGGEYRLWSEELQGS